MAPLKEYSNFNEVIEKIQSDRFPLNINGLSQSGKSYILNGIFEEIDQSMVIIAHSEMEAKNIYEDLSLYTTEVYLFPAKEVVFYNVDAISGDLRWARLKVIKEIIQNKNKKIIVASIDALTTLYTTKESYEKYSMTIKSGSELNLKSLAKKLSECGYERVEVVEGKGEFSFRGGILDVFPPTAVYPYRIELFGDEIESIRTFNVESQRSIEKVENFDIFAAKEVIVSEEVKNFASNKIREEFKEQINKKNTNKESAEKLGKIVNRNLELLNETNTFETIDSYLPFFYEEPENFFDYLKGYLYVVDDVKRCQGKIESIYYEFN